MKTYCTSYHIIAVMKLFLCLLLAKIPRVILASCLFGFIIVYYCSKLLQVLGHDRQIRDYDETSCHPHLQSITKLPMNIRSSTHITSRSQLSEASLALTTIETYRLRYFSTSGQCYPIASSNQSPMAQLIEHYIGTAELPVKQP